MPTPKTQTPYDPELACLGRDKLIEKIHEQQERISKQETYVIHLRESWDRAEEKWRSNARYYKSEREQRQQLQIEVKDLTLHIDELVLRVDQLKRQIKALECLEDCDGSVSISRGPSGEFRVRVLNGCSWQPGDPAISKVEAAQVATPAIEDADLSSAILQAFSAGDHS